jgi:hypothetical protein
MFLKYELAPEPSAALCSREGGVAAFQSEGAATLWTLLHSAFHFDFLLIRTLFTVFTVS